MIRNPRAACAIFCRGVRRREHVVGIVRGVYDRYGFELSKTGCRDIETLLGGQYGDGTAADLQILKRGEHEASGEATWRCGTI